MSEIKTLEDMRNTVKTIAADCDEGWILGCLDAIESEIAEKYMKLPVDADGVPIHMDDMLKSENASKPFIVESMTFADSWTVWDRENGATRWPSECHHVKPRTIEDVLDELADEIIRQGHQAGLTAPGIIAKYADELRGMGVGE